MSPNTEKCEHCGMTYDRFRTGATFGEIVRMLWVDNPDSSTWRYKRRNTVLGFWRQMKLQMWDGHLAQCAAAHNQPDEGCEFEPLDAY